MTSNYRILVMAVVVAGLAACESPRPAASRPANVPSAGSVDHQQREIDVRIEQNFRSGRLTRDDYRALKNRADELRREERGYMADSDLALSEQQRLNSQLENLSRDVDRRSNNRR